jgi:hypothetical protein
LPSRNRIDGFVDDEGTRWAGSSGWPSIARAPLLVADDVGNVVWRVTPARP